MRLEQGCGRPFTLDIEILNMHALIIPRLIRQLLAAVMYCVQRLNITLPAVYLSHLWPILDMRAPELLSILLHLLLVQRQFPTTPISPSIFHRNPGKLSRVILRKVLLPTVHVPAFANIATLVADYEPNTVGLQFPQFWLVRYPRLRVFSMGVARMRLSEAVFASMLPALHQLDQLQIVFNPQYTAAFIRLVPLARIPMVIVWGRIEADVMEDFLRPLRSPFLFAIIRVDRTRLWIMLRDVWTGFVRAVSEEIADYYNAEPGANPSANVLFDNAELGLQIESLAVSNDLWPFMSKYLRANFTSISTLLIEIEWLQRSTVDPQRLPPSSVAWPGLQTLIVQSRNGLLYVVADDFVAFTDGLSPQCRRLELRGILLWGSTQRLSSRFDYILTTMDHLWPDTKFAPANTGRS